MGRYYNGDINGKFMFAIQSSSSADRFGVIGEAPAQLSYYFSEDNLDDVESEILRIELGLGDKLQHIEKFFLTNMGYNDKILKEVNITNEELSEFSDLRMGIKIRDCIKENGECSFTAEF